MFCKNGVVRNFATFTGKHLCHSFFIKVADHRCFPVNFAKFLRIPFLTEHINDFIFPFLIKRKAYKFSKEYY